jgi:N6-L-threonylcarbamoyladenine synthase
MTEKQDTITLLAIESSCDDTAAAIIRNGKILANIVSSQEIHKEYGGVIPELAGRAHQQNILPVVKKALEEAGIEAQELNGIAYTQGPGLMGSLLVGGHFSKGMCMALNIPSIGVNHLHAHVAAHYLNETMPNFPFLCLLVSGGHTQIIKVNAPLDMEIIGSTIDDAAGEAFDKTAKMLGLPYPGGPLIDQYAELGNPLAYRFPIARIEGYGYSFSGLKTSVINHVRRNPEMSNVDVAASFQAAVVDVLCAKTIKAAQQVGAQGIVLGGGVSANTFLRSEMTRRGGEAGFKVALPSRGMCTDNAAMIAAAAWHRLKSDGPRELDCGAYPNLKLAEVPR